MTSVEQLERLALTALASNGVQHSNRLVEWDISGSCESPVAVERYSRATDDPRFLAARGMEDFPGMTVILHTPCRRCPACARKRAAEWRWRAMNECQRTADRGGRTWFATLTMTPENHFAAEAALSAAQPNFDALDDAAKFRLRAKAMGIEATKWLKRVRKNSGAPLRYLLASEIHSGGGDLHGYPHMHALMHEIDPAEQVPKRLLEKAWTKGFSKFKLTADNRAAVYLTKYLSKSLEARVRASIGYGDTPSTNEESANHALRRRAF